MEREIFNCDHKGSNDSYLQRDRCDAAVCHHDDCVERHIDWNEQLVKNKASTFFFRMNGDSMEGAGIFSGDVLIVDRSISNANGKVIVAVLNGEMLVRRFEKTFNKIRLIPQTNKLAVIDVDPFSEFLIWGVVTYVVHAP